MYKTLYQLDVYIKGRTDPGAFYPDASAIALNQIKAGRDIDAQATDNGETFNLIVPYHAIEYVIVNDIRRSEPDPEDDNLKNCTGGGEVETGTLTIINPNDTPSSGTIVNLLLSEPATYSGIEFSVVHSEGMTFIVGTIPSIAAGESFTLEGIPVGTQYYVAGATEETMEGSVPAEAVLRVMN